MAITYVIQQNTGIIKMTISGDVTVKDFTDYLDATANDPAYQPELHRLVVVRSVASFPKSAEMQAVGSRLRPRHTGTSSRIAVVIDTPLGRGMIAMLTGNAGLSSRYRIFDDVTSATLWLLTSGAP